MVAEDTSTKPLPESSAGRLRIPLLTPLLTGPLPPRFARTATHLPAMLATLIGPFVLIVIFLSTPVLPSVAIQLTDDRVVLGYVVTIDDTVTTLLDDAGAVRFVPNEAVAAKVLCGDAEQVPHTTVDAHGVACRKDGAGVVPAPTCSPAGRRGPVRGPGPVGNTRTSVPLGMSRN